MGHRIVLLAALTVVLCGCSYFGTFMAERSMKSARAFCEEKRNNPAVGVLVGKLPIVTVEEITPDMLALDAVPTAPEVEAIRALSHDQRSCRDRMNAVAENHWPTQLATRQALALKLDLVTAELLMQRMSYGNANRLYKEAALEAQDKLTEQAKEELELAREQEKEAWRTISDGIRAVAGSQKPEPTNDPCTWVDNTVDCRAN
jgi:hypothetical protein